MGLYRRAWWRITLLMGVGVVGAAATSSMLLGPVAVAAPAPAKPSPADAPDKLPALPSVPLGITDGVPAKTLLANALTLASVGIDTSALQAAIGATQAKLVKDNVTAQQMDRLAAAAAAKARVDEAAATEAEAGYSSLDTAVKDAVLFLYTDGPNGLQINPNAGNALAYAADYADSAVTPDGLLSTRRYDAKQQKKALNRAKKAERVAEHDAAKAAKALADAQSQQEALTAELASVSASAAAAVTSDHTALAAQAGNELVSASSLQFTPKSPLPHLLATTSVALTWAFSELGKRYVWGATGPNTFDCSGLTQYVWHQAGVNIPRVAADQDAWTVPVPLSQLLPGDLVFFGTTDIHHVGIYIGDGLMINAPHTGDVVRVSPIWWSDLAGFGRVHAPGTPVPLHQTPTIQKPATPAVVHTAGPVPSQTKPPPGWKPTPGASTPLKIYPGGPPPTVTVPTTVAPTTSTSSTTSTTTTSTTSTTSTSTTVPDSTTTTAPSAGSGGSVPGVPDTSTTVPAGTP